MPIASKVPEIADLRFKDLKQGTVVEARRVMQLEHSAAVIELADGSFAVIGGNHALGKYCLTGFGANGLEDDPTKADDERLTTSHSAAVLRGLAKIGAISREAVNTHIRHETEKSRTRTRFETAQRLTQMCEELGIQTPELPADIDLSKRPRRF